jgi:hypothetical protein
MKYIATFGSNQLNQFNVNSMNVMLVLEGNYEDIRTQLFNFPGIGANFCTTYNYEAVVEEFKNKFKMKEYTLEDLEKLRRRNILKN